MSWHGSLQLQYRRDADRTIAHDLHHGPLRVLRALYPEGGGVCHHVLVHPPGGIAGGDTLDIDLKLGACAHALITTPGATRFYRSSGPAAHQHLQARLAAQARLEWLPMETLVFNGARASNLMSFHLHDDAQMIGWDSLALGLPASDEAFRSGSFTQEISLPGAWLERGLIAFDEPTLASATQRLLDSPLGWAGMRVLSTLWCASGSPWTTTQSDALLEAARAAITRAEEVTSLIPAPRNRHAAWHAGTTAVDPKVIVVRILAERTEAAWVLMQAIRAAWRNYLWSLDDCTPRVWRT